MRNDNKKRQAAWVPELPPAEFSETRSAAAAWLYALDYEKDQDMAQMRPLLAETFPHADLDRALEIARGGGACADVVGELLAMSHFDGYELIPWREAVVRVLVLDFLASLKTPSAQLTEDAVIRVTDVLGEQLRGTTKNACQIVSGQRTRMRRAVRSLAVAALYAREFRRFVDIEDVLDMLAQVVARAPEDDFFPAEYDFPFDEFLGEDNRRNPATILIFR